MTTTTRRPQWTRPHYGVQHLGQYGTQTYWCTVCDYGSFATLSRHVPGSGFSPNETDHETAEEARREGEYWLAQQR